ncbi:nucleolar transcription factor 1-A-like [Diorhabda sublineata]|uniref:nucleolar transcription factor 1-A-like n=1 Tax=Diorhabda sublineata TaxID=1163346 RepID=UPI0024E06620|nr:nucleolar transcription factor 1-A-like [Diorhabda sublineata]XP_056645984.1 nucleolar transcription factor 1-A-like [Diorhabda sublineata]XP_056645985.1 nucleolar transcription factor 1-A-like [Diorhabda sublineata]
MYAKKNKKNINNVDTGEDNYEAVVKKTKKRKNDITNENTNIENKSKKRKLATREEESVSHKKLKKKVKGITVLENNTELHVTEDNSMNNMPTTKNTKRKNNAAKTLSTETTNLDIGDKPEVVTKTSKKSKKKTKTIEDEFKDTKTDIDAVGSDPGEGVSYTKHYNNSNISNDMVVDNNEEQVMNSTKQLMHQEVDIIDIKTDNVNEDNEKVVTISIKDIAGMDSDCDENILLKQLERRVEKKDITKEKRVCINWPEVDLIELVERMEVGIPENDLKPFMKTAEELEWEKIAFKNYTIEDCKKTWLYVLKKIRKYRILKEVLEDAKKWVTTARFKKKPTKVQRHPDMPRRPLSAYFIFYLKEKDALQVEHPGIDATELAKYCAQKFKLLPAEKMQKYEKLAKKNKEEYEQKMKEFYELHPEFKVTKEPKPKKIKSPKPVKEKPPPKPPKPPKQKIPKRPLSAFQYFHNAEVSKNPVEDQDKTAIREINREKWREMPDDKKMEWITFAESETVRYEEEMQEYVKNHPDYITNEKKPQLSKEDLLVKERMSGKPSKPPVTAYNYFARLMLHSDEIKDVPVRDRLVFVSNQWKKCSDEEKKRYKELFEKEIEKYNQAFAAYLETLSEADRKLELLKSHPKRRKSEDEKSKKESKSKKPLKKKVEPKPEKKSMYNKVLDKKPEKIAEKPRKLVEPEQPPISPYRYFATLYKGEGSASQAWKGLSTDEKKKYEDELVDKKRAYILDFEKFLKSMTKEELEKYSNSRKKLNNQKHEEEDEEEEETSDSDDNSEDESGEENN